jgi:glycerophosphoryl diester phosphodiesterase
MELADGTLGPDRFGIGSSRADPIDRLLKNPNPIVSAALGNPSSLLEKGCSMAAFNRKVLNIAHRGARSLSPENTLPAVIKAFQTGADLWETDVVATRDGELILFHDDSLARTTNVEALFPDRFPFHYSTFTFEEIRRLDAGIRFIETDPFGQIAAGAVSSSDLKEYQEVKIPTLKEALDLTRRLDWRVNLELKDLPPPLTDFPLPERVICLIESSGFDVGRLIISSFNHAWLRRVKKMRSDIVLHALIGDSDDEPQDWGNFEFDTYNANHLLTDEAQIRRALEKGVTVNLWTVNDPDEMKRFIRSGVSGFFTDFPQRLAEVLKEERNSDEA